MKLKPYCMRAGAMIEHPSYGGLIVFLGAVTHTRNVVEHFNVFIRPQGVSKIIGFEPDKLTTGDLVFIPDSCTKKFQKNIVGEINHDCVDTKALDLEWLIMEYARKKLEIKRNIKLSDSLLI